MKYTDKQLLDYLEKQNAQSRYTGRCIFRISEGGRGWRLHETSVPQASVTVREEIGKMLDAETEIQTNNRKD